MLSEDPLDAEILSPTVKRMLSTDQSLRFLGIRVLSASSDRAIAQMEITADMANGHRIAHGGLIFTLADTAFICACAAEGQTPVTSSGSIVYLSPGRVGDVLTATAEVRHRVGKVAHCDVRVTSQRGVVAEFRGSAISVATK